MKPGKDLAVMKDLHNSNPSGYTSTICFHAQQAVEKYLKAFLAFHDIDFPRTHDVDYLLMECQKIDSTTGLHLSRLHLVPGKNPRRRKNILLWFTFETECPGDDAYFEGVNGSCIGKVAVDDTSLNKVNGISDIDLGGEGIDSQSIKSSR